MLKAVPRFPHPRMRHQKTAHVPELQASKRECLLADENQTSKSVISDRSDRRQVRRSLVSPITHKTPLVSNEELSLLVLAPILLLARLFNCTASPRSITLAQSSSLLESLALASVSPEVSSGVTG